MVNDFNTTLSIVDRTSEQIKKKYCPTIEGLPNIVNQADLIDI